MGLVKFVAMNVILFVISGVSCEEDETYALLGYYAASIGNSLPMFRATYGSLLQGSTIFTLENGADRLPETSEKIITTSCVTTQKSAGLKRTLYLEASKKLFRTFSTFLSNFDAIYTGDLYEILFNYL